ncbi:hypothetical protein ASPWEDRAFT_102595 [Aspergillus wentii DTO 134E9]|uniref:Cytochrome P450 n=1 Tax=Aspergillus wentii DTO 134E9 TaxID=1073089 RepID=A0A1L9S2W7_ASPWE|nr:uncharacterized protein ASPWEDRAFT_102595 [Aspergillus wentii DTO 134E9]OJJ41504.1 hypothetical protein ASPWEDRAFT_102595 [Aspergillus wentii DTO 134E9]
MLTPLLFTFILFLIYHLYKTISSPLSSLPGPILTRLTRLWYFHRVRNGHFEQDNISLHKQYGPIVRVAPNMYSVADLSSIKTIYGMGSKFPKSDWYEVWKHPDPDRWALFPDRDVRRHAETRKRFTNLFSMSSVVHYESFVDDCADIFIQRVKEHADTALSLDMGHWFQCYAFDVIGNITFGERFGFLDRGEDIQGTIAALRKVVRYGTLIGIYPRLHPWLFGILSRFSWSGAGGRLYIMQFVQRMIAKHGQSEKQHFLGKMVKAKEENPDKVTDYHLFIMCQSNIVAGSDTTAVTLSAIVYHLCRCPDVLSRLKREIDEYTVKGKCSEKVTFKESQDMPYLQAVIKEALRIHSANGLPLWREVPEGMEISGRFFPAGTVVGVNVWVAHYNEDVFEDAASFRPERWIEAGPDKLKAMNEMFMPFGLGSRTCLGRHISILEISKLVPRLLREFDFTLLRENWTTENLWFVKPTDLDVLVRKIV